MSRGSSSKSGYTLSHVLRSRGRTKIRAILAIAVLIIVAAFAAYVLERLPRRCEPNVPFYLKGTPTDCAEHRP